MGNIIGNINCCVDDKIKFDDNKRLYQMNRLKENKPDKELIQMIHMKILVL